MLRGNEKVWLSLTIRILQANTSAASRGVSRKELLKSHANCAEGGLKDIFLSLVQ